ncbi:MAG: hypothetical protein WAU02_02510 [Candidatus Saccharimonadales bacterium]
MDVTIMRSTSLLARLRSDYPDVRFQKASVSRWSPRERTVYFTSTRGVGAVTLLHEAGHAIASHQAYHQDIDLLRCEREAWAIAQAMAPHYGLTITDHIISESMATYRQWLHDRSRCPSCGHGALQHAGTLKYYCLLCNSAWHANDARQCGLRRYSTP